MKRSIYFALVFSCSSSFAQIDISNPVDSKVRDLQAKHYPGKPNKKNRCRDTLVQLYGMDLHDSPSNFLPLAGASGINSASWGQYSNGKIWINPEVQRNTDYNLKIEDLPNGGKIVTIKHKKYYHGYDDVFGEQKMTLDESGRLIGIETIPSEFIRDDYKAKAEFKYKNGYCYVSNIKQENIPYELKERNTLKDFSENNFKVCEEIKPFYDLAKQSGPPCKLQCNPNSGFYQLAEALKKRGLLSEWQSKNVENISEEISNQISKHMETAFGYQKADNLLSQCREMGISYWRLNSPTTSINDQGSSSNDSD